VRAPALADAVTHLPWLSPCAASLVALARQPAAIGWDQVRVDPGGVLLLVERFTGLPTPTSDSFVPVAFQDPTILEKAIRHLDQADTGFVDWNQAAVRPVYHAGLSYARLATYLAERTGCCDPDHAWAAGLLAPLGWYAIGAIAPLHVTSCLTDAEWTQRPSAVQQRHWGLDQAGIARRLARRWGLPRWLAAVCGYLDLPVATAQLVGADPALFSVVQVAVGLAQRHGCPLYLYPDGLPSPGAENLGMSTADMEAATRAVGAFVEPPSASQVWTAPSEQPLLRDLLLVAADHRRLSGAPVRQSLESDLDHLHHALREQQASEKGRLQALKLNAMAEFAAGAGHEINNPLAVISGQAQYLLHHENEPARQRALQAIVNQTQRIHQLLRGLMEYARPQRPQKQPVDLSDLLHEVAASLEELATQRRVQLQCPHSDQPVYCFADPRQLRLALSCLLQNAIEAAPPEGWAGMRLETATPDWIAVQVEDSGPGLSRVQHEHLFDPFYSGRQAGRGRGLGLPTAWRLAQEHGGDLRYEDLPQGPTRFVLSLPRSTETNGLYPEPQPAKAS
jgi:signal transduction histidine kinase